MDLLRGDEPEEGRRMFGAPRVVDVIVGLAARRGSGWCDLPSCGHSDGVSVDNVDDASREREHPCERTKCSCKKHAYHQEDSVPAEHDRAAILRRFRSVRGSEAARVRTSGLGRIRVSWC